MKLRELNAEVGGKIKTIKFKHMVPMFKVAWEQAFTRERNQQGWIREGIIPFTRKQLWDLREQRLAASALSTSLSVTPNMQGSSQQANSRVSGYQQSSIASNAEETQDQPVNLPRQLLVAVRSAQQEKEEMPSLTTLAALSKEDLLQYAIKLRETILGVVDNAQGAIANGQMEDVEEGMLEDDAGFAGRITARNLWGLEGSVTGEEALAIARRRAEERRQQEEEKASRAADRDSRRRQAVAHALCRGAELLDKIKQGGSGVLTSLPVKDLQALMQSTDSAAPLPKGNKRELLEKVCEITGVKEAIECYNAMRVQAALAACAPPPPPPPPLPQLPLPPPPMHTPAIAPELPDIAPGVQESEGSCPAEVSSASAVREDV